MKTKNLFPKIEQRDTPKIDVRVPCDSDLRNTQHRGASGSPLPRDQEGRDHQGREKVFRNDNKGVGISFFIFSLFQTRPGSGPGSLLRVTAAFADIKFVEGLDHSPRERVGECPNQVNGIKIQ